MTESVEKQILKKINKAKKGSLFFNEHFLDNNNHVAVRKALERLVKKGEIDRLTHGIYVKPKKDDLLGKVIPSIRDIAKAIAQRDKARIVATGAYALNQLGLSTQVPTNIVYLTDGTSRKIQIGNQKITFKKTTPKNVATMGEISTLVIQALRFIGSKNVTEEEIELIQNILKKEKKVHLEHDFYFAPNWIKEIMRPILKRTEHE